MNKIRVSCVDSGEGYPYSLVFDFVADYNQNLSSWDMHSGHGSASIEWVEEQKDAPNDIAFELLDAYKHLYAGWGDHTAQEYELVSISELSANYWEV